MQTAPRNEVRSVSYPLNGIEPSYYRDSLTARRQCFTTKLSGHSCGYWLTHSRLLHPEGLLARYTILPLSTCTANLVSREYCVTHRAYDAFLSAGAVVVVLRTSSTLIRGTVFIFRVMLYCFLWFHAVFFNSSIFALRSVLIRLMAVRRSYFRCVLCPSQLFSFTSRWSNK